MSHRITREEYDRIRAAIDARTRRIVAADDTVHDVGRCVGCGGEWRDVSAGCKSCWDRLRRRRRREDPVKHAHDLKVWREGHRRARERRAREAAA